MCEKCVELDGKIEHYRKLASALSDRLATEGIADRIKEMEAQKVHSILSKSDGPRSVPAIGVDDRVVMAAPFQRPPGGQCSPRRLSGCGQRLAG
jgi:hypothetical protein